MLLVPWIFILTLTIILGFLFERLEISCNYNYDRCCSPYALLGGGCNSHI